MIRARSRGVFRREYEIAADGGPVTTLKGTRKEGCEFTLDGAVHRIERDGKKRFLLHGPGGRVAVADRETGREWLLKAQSGNVKLVGPSFWKSRWEIHQRGSVRGEIRSEGFFSRTYLADTPPDVPVLLGVLALYVVMVHAERQGHNAAVHGGGGNS